ncbi:hypothetical protein MAPG_01521 [Magnaporthiopsis poae ATCC 64411]|uniref:Uncharacterized protein n=1 Tax=Magnaporthiopsis poae (strain ATCC 64411 / 73-15) TaxID=644358 RepID=A0A0C4DNX4_MAGP6|nr:hypothetical protein MAPG_01521 [Magnaporthiopsis poae ATCC 64411]
MEGVKKTYNEQYEKWVPWLEDMFLRYFTKDNKASYATKAGAEGVTMCKPLWQAYLIITSLVVSCQ